jgi:uncharacterized protein (TIGR02145 family)
MIQGFRIRLPFLSCIFLIFFVASGCSKDREVAEEIKIVDADGNVYNPVEIGTQVWLKENLKTTRYNNGDQIGTTIPADKDISGEAEPKYQWSYEGDENHVQSFGRLYTWYTITDSRGVCPAGWHIPSADEYDDLVGFFSSSEEAFNALREAGTEHWLYPNTGTNASGFTARPAGRRLPEGKFCGLYYVAFFWNSTSDSWHPGKWAHALSVSGNCCHGNFNNSEGFSVRCIKD